MPQSKMHEFNEHLLNLTAQNARNMVYCLMLMYFNFPDGTKSDTTCFCPDDVSRLLQAKQQANLTLKGKICDLDETFSSEELNIAFVNFVFEMLVKVVDASSILTYVAEFLPHLLPEDLFLSSVTGVDKVIAESLTDAGIVAPKMDRMSAEILLRLITEEATKLTSVVPLIIIIFIRMVAEKANQELVPSTT